MQQDNGKRWPHLESCHARLGAEGEERSLLCVACGGMRHRAGSQRLAIRLPQHLDEHCPQDPVLLVSNDSS
jgi:hypothetical protein